MNINSDTAKGRGVRTALQALGGFLIGLLLAIWHVPGVPQTVHLYVIAHFKDLLPVVAYSSIGGGLISWLWNRARTTVPH